MSSTNPFKRLKDVVGVSPLMVGEVVSSSGGTVLVQMPDGRQIRVRGSGYSVGANVFVRDGVVEGDAPALPLYAITLY